MCNFTFPAKEVNTLARKRFEEQLLKDISVDLMICKIEGWDKAEYIKELHSMLNDIVEKIGTKNETNR